MYIHTVLPTIIIINNNTKQIIDRNVQVYYGNVHHKTWDKNGTNGIGIENERFITLRSTEQFKEIGVRLTEPVLPFTDSFGCDIAEQFCNQFVLETKR